MKYNADWRNIGNGTFQFIEGAQVGIVRPQVTRDYAWEVHEKGQIIASGVARDRILGMAIIEKLFGYHFEIEPEMELEKGCRCGSCQERTGRWLVWNRDDTINLVFDSEAEAIAWVESQPEPVVE